MLKRLQGIVAAVLLGGLLSFYIDQIWRSSERPHQPTHYRSDHATNNEQAAYNPFRAFWNWTTADPVGFYTSVVSLFTGALVVIFAIQIRYLIRADNLARRSSVQSAVIAKRAAAATRVLASAAQTSAKAAIAAELPIIALSRFQLFRRQGDVRGPVVGYPGEVSEPEFEFRNAGRSAAELTNICVEWAVVRKLPELPPYKLIIPYAPSVFLERDKPFPARLNNYIIRLQADEVLAIEEESKFLWVFGFLSYQDTMGNPHEWRFCAKWQPFDHEGKSLGFIHDSETPKAYVKKT